jgi:hypothetical protein
MINIGYQFGRLSKGEISSRQFPLVPKIACPQEYEAALSVLNCINRGEIELLAKAYRDRILEWEDHDYLFED